MSYPKWLQSFTTIRIFSYILPPLGLILLWLTPLLTRRRKILGTIHVTIYTLGIGFGLAVMGALLWTWHVPYMEWRGSYMPTMTLWKTTPNYSQLEANRAEQSKIAVVPKISPVTNTPYWTGFRGPQRDGHYQQQNISTNWPATGLRELWHQPVGGGYASFSIAEGRAYTIEQRREQEVVAAYDEETGHELWTHSWEAHFDEGIGGDGPRATPSYNDGRIYALGGTGELRCLEAATGKLIWRRDSIAENGGSVLTYGTAASPLVVENKVIVLPGGADKSVVAYDKLTGEPLWKSHYDKQAYTSPMLVDLGGQRQLLIVSAFHALGL
ncbi:MAG: repeat-like protein, partial [Verrucomicrobiales bacterium]|nr:repeat-like protein [Verrucomicrobiales bacterium]